MYKRSPQITKLGRTFSFFQGPCITFTHSHLQKGAVGVRCSTVTFGLKIQALNHKSTAALSTAKVIS